MLRVKSIFLKVLFFLPIFSLGVFASELEFGQKRPVGADLNVDYTQLSTLSKSSSAQPAKRKKSADDASSVMSVVTASSKGGKSGRTKKPKFPPQSNTLDKFLHKNAIIKQEFPTPKNIVRQTPIQPIKPMEGFTIEEVIIERWPEGEKPYGELILCNYDPNNPTYDKGVFLAMFYGGKEYPRTQYFGDRNIALEWLCEKFKRSGINEFQHVWENLDR